MTRFYSNDQAAKTIAEALHLEDQSKRDEISSVYWHVIYNALCRGELAGRYPDTRLPIDLTRLGAPIGLTACLISEEDLDAWLTTLGVGIDVLSISASSSNSEAQGTARFPLASKPTSKEIAAALGSFLKQGNDEHWLLQHLGNANRFPELKACRELVGTIKPIARWNPSGVVLYLVKIGRMTNLCGKNALQQHYPGAENILDHVDSNAVRAIKTEWYSPVDADGRI